MIFKQLRVGKNGKCFTIYKFRTMKNDSHTLRKDLKELNKGKGPLFKIENDPRVINGANFIRDFSLDEIPQLINVLKGDMSIVGPRPHMVEHDIHYSSLFGNFLKRHKCNPGLTGWAQVNGLRGATPAPEIMKRRMEFDLWYLNNWTIFLDVYIIFKTFYAIFKYKGD